MNQVLIEVARARRVAALDAVEKRQDNVFDTGKTRTLSRPLFVTSRIAA